MKQKVIEKIAAQDAYDYGLAQMFFGEGAGNRRKFIGTIVDQKMQDIPGYAEAFDKAFGKLNQIEIAEKALKERKAIDRAAKASQNFRALKNGSVQNLTTGVFVAYGTYWVCKQTGYDKVIEAEVKKAKAWVIMKYKINKAKKETPR